MFDITIEGPRENDGSVKTKVMSVPSVPQLGSYVSLDAHGLSGNVHNVDFWWDEKDVLTIMVQIR